ncbi:lipopolysaccharide assembly protein LapB [uncultured Bacteroides sp.]|uniref:tetratricopeptide repeat protein n=1 Tax=uncultured Bacteroides sp. TaxID=162156 RepID=UPI002675F0A1|nr:hypothetical protein [uncultured Bacteroides sp.]
MKEKNEPRRNAGISSSLITNWLSLVFFVFIVVIIFFFLYRQCSIGEDTVKRMSGIESRLMEKLENVADSPDTHADLVYCKESLHAELELIKVRFNDFSSSITLILSVITIVFVIFSFLGLMKVQDELKRLEKDKEEFERRIKENWEKHSAAMDADREEHKRKMSVNLEEMQVLQDESRVENLLSEYRYKEVDMICRKYEGEGRERPYFIYASARVDMNRGDYKSACDKLNRVVPILYNGVRHEYYYYLGEAYFYLEEFEFAGKYVEKAIEILKDKSSLPGVGSSEDELRIIDETCLSSQKTLSKYSCLLGRIYLSAIPEGNFNDNSAFEKVLSSFALALQWDKRNTDILMWIAITYRKKKEFSRSKKILNNIISINTEMWYYYHELAVTYYCEGLSYKESGNFSMADECFKRAEKKYHILFGKMDTYHLTDDYGFHYYLGVIYIEWGKLKEAEKELIRSIRNNKEAKTYYFYDLGRAYFITERYDLSSKYLKQACEKSEEKESIYLFYLALSYVYQLERVNDFISWEEISRLLEKAIYIDGDKEFYYTHSVAVYLASGRVVEAEEYLERYSRLTDGRDKMQHEFLYTLLNAMYYLCDVDRCGECLLENMDGKDAGNLMNGLVNFTYHSLEAGLRTGMVRGGAVKSVLDLLREYLNKR